MNREKEVENISEEETIEDEDDPFREGIDFLDD